MKPSRGLIRWAVGGALFLGLYAVVGFFVLPAIVKAQAEKRLSAELGREVSIGKVRMNPFALSVTVEGFDIQETDAAGSFLGWDRLYVNFEAVRSLTGDWVLHAIELDGFHGAAVMHPDASFNFSDLLEKFGQPADEPDKPSRPIRIVRLAVSQARLAFSDRSYETPFTSVIEPLTFTLTEFRTAGVQGAPYEFQAVTESGEQLSWRGTLAAEPLESKGEFEIKNILLAKYAPYIEDHIQADLTGGMLSVSGGYEAGSAGGEHVLRLVDGQLQLRDLRVNERAGGEPVVELASADVTGIQADAIALEVAIDSVAAAGGRLALRRDEDGLINVLTMLEPADSSAPPPAASPAQGVPAALPEVAIRQIELRDFAMEFTDEAAPGPARIALRGVGFAMQDFTLAEGALMPLEVSFDWEPQGRVAVAGTVGIFPEMTAELKTEVAALDLVPVSPYLEGFVNARLTGGAISATNTMSLSLRKGEPDLELAGELTVEGFALVDSAHNEELAGFSSLVFTGLGISTAPELALSITEVSVTGPYARVIIEADQSINLTSLAISEAPAPAPSAPPAESDPTGPAPLPRIAIGSVVIGEGNFSFTDRSLEPNVRIALTQFGGTVSGISSEDSARADVDLKGIVDGAGPVAIAGQLDPLGSAMFVDLGLNFRNLNLMPLSPYVGKYAGYELARGSLVVESKFRVEGTKIDAVNSVTLNQFTFGAPTNSRDATTLPVRLGVALLKDIDGRIVMDIPVQGQLDDPSFGVGKVVLQVVVNLLTRAAASPFSLIGSMFGGGGEELAFQEFAPGAIELQPAGIPKLETMVKALLNRPSLGISLQGAYDASADTRELKRQKVLAAVRSRMEGGSEGANLPPAQLVLTPDEHGVLVRELYDETFPPGSQLGTPLPPPAPELVPYPPRAGLIRRIAYTVTGRERRLRIAVDAENARRAGEHERAVADLSAAEPSFEQMIVRLVEAMEVTESELGALASARALSVRDYLTGNGEIAEDRIFLMHTEDGAKQDQGPRVFLSLH